MLYGIFSDIHSNLEALNAVLDFFSSKNAKHYLCAGDIVGYGPDPNECVNTIRELKPLAICVGNHDRAACGLKEHIWFNEYARKALAWTAKTLTENNQIYLSELPKCATLSDITLVHGSPREPLDEYLLMHRQYEENLPLLKTGITLVGHTHIPLIFGGDMSGKLKDSEPIVLEKDRKYIVNPGAVGQPRDGNNKAACALFYDGTRTLELFRVDYDIVKTQSKMRKHKLPAFLIERLSWGN